VGSNPASPTMISMLALILTVLLILALLVGSEIWWRSRHPHDEFSRKFIHITVGSIAAFWPFYLHWHWILILSGAFIVIVLFSRYFNIFKSIHAVGRPTWGELFFALAVGGLAMITHDKWMYAAALLHMSLADGIAAVVGVTWGAATRYKVMGHPKSLAGSAAFFIVSVGILLGYSHFAHPLSPILLGGIALSATIIENFGIAGLDNLLVPLLVGAALSRMV
jgi:phytol kinase